MVIAVIGAGSIGRRHAENLQALGRDVALIPWREFDRAAFEKCSDVKGMVIATATDVRLDLVQTCATLDIPFYVEKPLHGRLRAWPKFTPQQVIWPNGPCWDLWRVITPWCAPWRVKTCLMFTDSHLKLVTTCASGVKIGRSPKAMRPTPTGRGVVGLVS